MALIICPECNKEISDKAGACPHCGCPVIKAEENIQLPETVTCLECKKEVPFEDEVCPHCGLFNSQKYKFLRPESEDKELVSSQPIPTRSADEIAKSKKRALILFAAIAFFVFGNLHIISTSNGFKIVEKSSFGFQETFINLDEVSGMPWITATSKYPLSVKALQRAGLIETDEQRELRIKTQLQIQQRGSY